MRRRYWLVMGLGLTATLLAGCGASSGDHDDDSMETSGVMADQHSGANSFAPGAGEEVAGAPGSDGEGTAAPLEDGRKVIFTSELTLEADDVTARFLEIGRIAATAGGFVAESQLIQQDQSEGRETHGSITIRVPASARDDVLVRLRTLEGVTVDAERSSATEVTEEYTDLQSRLRNLERSEQQYLLLLDQAASIQDVLTVSERIDGVRSEVESIQGRLQVLDDMVDLATISVALQPAPAAGAEPTNDGGRTFASAWGDAWEAMGTVARGGAVAGAWLAVLAICAAPLLAIGAGVRMAVRRRHQPAAA